MATRSFVLIHPEVPKSLNAGGAGSRQHWSIAHKEKRHWQDIFRMLLLEARVPHGMTHCHVSPTIRWKHRNRRDSSNYVAPIIKPLADTLAPYDPGLVRWLPDDTDEYFTYDVPRFEYPESWPYGDPRTKGELVLRLDATYPPKDA